MPQSLAKLSLFLFSASPLVIAQDAPSAVKYWQFTGSVDGLYSLNFDHPAERTNLLRNFDTKANAFTLQGANFGTQFTTSQFGFHLDAGFGQIYRTIGATDPRRGANQYIGQLYASYRPIKGSNLQFDFGKFYTPVGAEVIDETTNFNHSRSLLFALGSPYYHFGLRATVPVTKSLTVGGVVVNGWNDVKDNNSGKTFGVTLTSTHAKWNWAQTYLAGPEKADTNHGFRYLYDSVLNVSPATWVQGYVEVLAGAEHRAQGNFVDARYDRWNGVAFAAKFNPAKKWSISPRWEMYNDSTGFTSGLAQHLTEATLTGEYRPTQFMTWRLEYRQDRSNQSFFNNGAKRTQQTLLVALLLYVKAER